jgi:transcriptional regulator with XRE-family HTH domain
MKYAITPALCRAARGLLDWSRDHLAEVSGAPSRTIADFELGNTVPRARTIKKLAEAFERSGVEFTNGDAPGVRLRKALGD